MQVKVPNAILSTLLACILTACGATNKPTTSIHVLLTDFQFQPSLFTVPANKEISFAATNSGAVDHSFIIMKLGHEVKGHFGDADRPNIFWQQGLVPAGSSVKSEFTAPSEPGEYQILCGNAGHLEAGMVGKLLVVSEP